MQCQNCGLPLDPQQVAQTGRCPRCGVPVAGMPQGFSTPQPPFQSGPPAGAGGANDDESPTIRVRPPEQPQPLPTPPPAPQQPPSSDPFAATMRSQGPGQPPSGPYGQQPPASGPYGQQPPASGPYGQQPPAAPYGQQPGTNYGSSFPGAADPYGLAGGAVPPPPPPPQPGFGAQQQPGFGAPQQPGFGAPQQNFGPPPQQFSGPPPAFGSAPTAFSGPPPAPGFPGGPTMPPKKSRTGLIIGIIVVLLVVLAGGTLTALGFSGKGPLSSLGPKPTATATPVPTATATAQPTATDTPTTSGGFTAFTSPDNTFIIAYPSDWQKKDPSQGMGADFTGPNQQVFLVANLGAVSGTPKEFDDSFCGSSGFGGTPSTPKTVSIGGQDWTQEECDNSSGSGHAIVESVIYKGNFYYIAYASDTASFQSNVDQFFLPMEVSFIFNT